MKRILPALAFLLLGWPSSPPMQSAAPQFGKDALAASIDGRGDESWTIAKQIWDWAEPGYHEVRSSALLAETLEKAGFRVERGVAEIPTAFTATIGTGEPVIGILGEFDALPGLSQEVVPYRKPRRTGNGYGHACGHHLFGVASMSACLAVGEQIKAGRVRGTLRFYGCPAEEGGSAKAFMVRAGLFRDCAAVLHWHPSSANLAGDRTCLARMAVKFRFHGIPSHASAAPEKGRSAVDALELTCHASELLREHVPERTRIHHVITAGGAAPNVVPEFAEVFFYIRHPQAEILTQLYQRLVKCAQAGALATETRLEIAYLGGTLEMVPNSVLADAIRPNLTRYNDIHYDNRERTFAVRIQETLPDKVPLESVAQVLDLAGGISMGSTDVGDVSWVVPTAGFTTACWVPGTPAHSWQAVAAGGMSIGRQGMQVAAKTLAGTAWDLFHRPDLLAAARADWQRRLTERTYKPLLEKGEKPPLDYRDPPRRGRRSDAPPPR